MQKAVLLVIEISLLALKEQENTPCPPTLLPARPLVTQAAAAWGGDTVTRIRASLMSAVSTPAPCKPELDPQLLCKPWQWQGGHSVPSPITACGTASPGQTSSPAPRQREAACHRPTWCRGDTSPALAGT